MNFNRKKIKKIEKLEKIFKNNIRKITNKKI